MYMTIPSNVHAINKFSEIGTVQANGEVKWLDMGWGVRSEVNIFAWILAVTFVISLLAFIGSLVLFLKEKVMSKVLLVLVAFSAGALLGGAFLHLLPEAILERGVNKTSLLTVFSYLLFGFCMFFILEQLIRWHHHHATSHPKIMPFSYLTLISDGLHNFIDG